MLHRIEFQVPQDDLTFTYVLDDADNLVSITSQEGSDPAVLVETFNHDGDGNMTTRTDVLTGDVITYAWNDFNKLVKVSSADGSGPTNTAKIDQRYDGSGIRKRKLDKAGDSSAEFTSGISTLASKAAVISSSSPTISYIQGHQIMGAEVNGVFQMWLTDALGTVRDVVDDTGTVIRSQEFDEHGKLLSSSGTGTFAPKTYQGALSVNDDRNDSGLYLMGHRHYASDLGRFISRDPIGFRGGLNLFNGAGTSPVRLVDPYGLSPSCGVDVFDSYGWSDEPNAHPVWTAKKNPPGLDPNYLPPVPYMKVTKSTSTRAVWNQLGGSNCKTGKKCFMVCTRNVMPSDGTMFAHAFLVFGPNDTDVYGLWQGDRIFRDSISITNWNAADFRYSDKMNVKCRLYCDDEAKVKNAEALAKGGTGYRTYIPGESNVWVRLVLQTAGISQWTGYDRIYPGP